MKPKITKIPIVYIPCVGCDKVPITEFPDEMLVRTYMEYAPYGAALDAVRMLEYALYRFEDCENRGGAVLRQCLSGGKCLSVVYPSMDEQQPEGSQLLGYVPDGEIYLV